MRRRLSISLCVAAAILWCIAPLAARAYGQEPVGAFEGRGRAEHRDGREDRARSRRLYTDEDLKRPVTEGFLRDVESLERQCFEAVNQQRTSRGLAPLELSVDLLYVARYYSRRMAEEGFFSHTDPEGRGVSHRVSEARIKWRVLGENLASSMGYVNPVAVSVRGWMNSPGHRKNILDNSYARTAVGVWISENGTVYFTEIFLK
jgi:uncharacterized protein YkwD